MGSRNEKSWSIEYSKGERKKKKNRKSNYFIKIILLRENMIRDNKEGIEARVPVKKRKNTSIDSFFNRVSFLLASLPSPPPLPFSKGKKKRRKKRKNTCECYENIHAYEKAHIRKDTHTHSLFHMDLHSIYLAQCYV